MAEFRLFWFVVVVWTWFWSWVERVELSEFELSVEIGLKRVSLSRFLVKSRYFCRILALNQQKSMLQSQCNVQKRYSVIIIIQRSNLERRMKHLKISSKLKVLKLIRNVSKQRSNNLKSMIYQGNQKKQMVWCE